MGRLLTIGGSNAGILAGLRAREVNPGVEVTLVADDAYPNFSICGIPQFISGEVPDWRNLAHRTVADLEKAGLHVRLDTRAEAIDAVTRTDLDLSYTPPLGSPYDAVQAAPHAWT